VLWTGSRVAKWCTSTPRPQQPVTAPACATLQWESITATIPFTDQWAAQQAQAVLGPCNKGRGACVQVAKQAHGDLQSWVQCDECGKWRTVAPAVLAAIEAAGDGAAWACAQARAAHLCVLNP